MLSRASTRGMINIAMFSGGGGILEFGKRGVRNIVGRWSCRGDTTLLKAFTIYSGVDFRSRSPVSSATRYHASYVRIETTNLTTSDAPSGADLLGHPLDWTRRKREEEREFRLFGFTENGAHFHLPFSLFESMEIGKMKVSCYSSRII